MLNNEALVKQHICYLLSEDKYEETLLSRIEYIRSKASEQIENIYSELKVLDYSKDVIQQSPPADTTFFNMEIRIQSIMDRLDEELDSIFRKLSEYRSLIGLFDLIKDPGERFVLAKRYIDRCNNRSIQKMAGLSPGVVEGYINDGIQELTILAIKYNIFGSENI